MTRRAVFLIAVVFLGIAILEGGRLYIGLSNDYYWTPMPMSLTPEAARDRVEIYIDGARIQRHPTMKLRFNNKDRVSRTRLVIIMFCLGVSTTLFVMGWGRGQPKT